MEYVTKCLLFMHMFDSVAIFEDEILTEKITASQTGSVCDTAVLKLEHSSSTGIYILTEQLKTGKER